MLVRESNVARRITTVGLLYLALPMLYVVVNVATKTCTQAIQCCRFTVFLKYGLLLSLAQHLIITMLSVLLKVSKRRLRMFSVKKKKNVVSVCQDMCVCVDFYPRGCQVNKRTHIVTCNTKNFKKNKRGICNQVCVHDSRVLFLIFQLHSHYQAIFY